MAILRANLAVAILWIGVAMAILWIGAVGIKGHFAWICLWSLITAIRKITKERNLLLANIFSF
jgi:hypothetical protein